MLKCLFGNSRVNVQGPVVGEYNVSRFGAGRFFDVFNLHIINGDILGHSAFAGECGN